MVKSIYSLTTVSPALIGSICWVLWDMEKPLAQLLVNSWGTSSARACFSPAVLAGAWAGWHPWVDGCSSPCRLATQYSLSLASQPTREATVTSHQVCHRGGSPGWRGGLL
ncbi:uncharacterized protein [Gorilla gorilla gorilla]|uniref:uncharacterized protein n=1 Tax=Gorilla gorilla gorilla TaxID=9595 RepID=UPI0024458248|nr:uncharacterized protein LOC115932994 [Gorilla gorilla gorilla]